MARAVAELCRPDAALSQHATGIHHVLPQPLLTWSGHVASWLEQGELPMHVVRYEDMLADPEGGFGGVLRFTGFEPDAGRAELSREEVRILTGGACRGHGAIRLPARIGGVPGGDGVNSPHRDVQAQKSAVRGPFK